MAKRSELQRFHALVCHEDVNAVVAVPKEVSEAIAPWTTAGAST